MSKEQENHKKIDLSFFKKEIEPKLPKEILDFHVHIWKKEFFKINPPKENIKGSNYLVIGREYSFEDLSKDANRLFPNKIFKAICCGLPKYDMDKDKNNNYISIGALERPDRYPLKVIGKGWLSAEKLEKEIIEGKFLGYKVFKNWYGDDYKSITVEDMIGPIEMKIANKYNLIVLLHVPRSDRLADPIVQKGVRNIATSYPNAQIVLAHCGRCYYPDQMKRAVSSIKDLDNIYFDTAMFMDPISMEILLEQIDSSRLIFGSDLPIPLMKGRRVYVMDHWVDLVLEGNPESAYRIQSNNMRATFMIYEIILAVYRAAERLKLSKEETESIFHDNGMRIINRVSI